MWRAERKWPLDYPYGGAREAVLDSKDLRAVISHSARTTAVSLSTGPPEDCVGWASLAHKDTPRSVAHGGHYTGIG